jgi:hypothetical protein
MHIHALEVEPCFWGEQHGARMNAGGKSLPVYDAVKAVGEFNLTEGEENVAIWELLYTDPFCELKAFSLTKEKKSVEINFFEKSLDERLDEEFQNKEFPEKFQGKLAVLGVTEIFWEAYKDIINSSTFKTIIKENPNSINNDRGIVARAIVALIMKKCDVFNLALPIQYDDIVRDQLVANLTDELGGTAKGLLGSVLKPFAGLAQTVTTTYGVRKRKIISDKVYKIPGDILVYMAHGKQIRQFIQRCIDEATPPVVLLAHSLGGIASFDLLILEHIPQVKLLITIGSQVPFLYEIDTLQSLRYGKMLPLDFPEWLNLYNQRDFLSYVGSSLFDNRVKDIEIRNRQPFPQSHDALSYLSNQAAWDYIINGITRIHE